MFRRIHHLLLVAVGLFWASAAEADLGFGYLPKGGPVGLRFKVPPPPLVEKPDASLNLPPKPPAGITNAAQPISLPTPPMPGDSGTNSTNSAALNISITNGPPVEYNARDGESGSDMQPITIGSGTGPGAVVVPQMLVKYFTTNSNTNLGTNSISAGRPTTSLGFTPPAAAVVTAVPATTPAPSATPAPAPGNAKPGNSP